MLRSLLSLSILIAFVLPGFAHARANEQVDVTFRTYDEMMLMTPEHRLEYLIEMRKILMELEKNSESGLDVAVNDGTFQQWLNMFGIAKANADALCNDDETFDNATGVCYRVGIKAPLAGYNCRTITDPNNKNRGSLVCARMPTGGATSLTPTPGAQGASTLPPKDLSRLPGGASTPPKGSGQADSGQGAPADPQGKPAPKADAGPSEAPVEPGQKDWSVGCSPHPLVCQDREKYRAQFYALKTKCLYAGNISEYPGGKPKKGKCAPVTKSTVNPDGAQPCPGGQVICNPLVFGMTKGADGKFSPICVKQGPEATEECDTTAPKGNIDQLFKDKFPGFKNEWDKFVTDLKKICDASDKQMATAQFHCKECNIMHKRLFNLEQRIQGVKLCQGGPGTSSAKPSVRGDKLPVTPASAPANK